MSEASTSIDVQDLAAGQRRGSILGRVAYVLRVHRWLLIFVIAYFLAAVATSAETGRELIMPWGYLNRVLFILGILIPWGIAGYSGYLLWRFRPRHPIGF